MWLVITWSIVLAVFVFALFWAFKQGRQYGISQESNESYEAENNARAIKRHIAKRLRELRNKG
jgi:nitrogen fixation-related uncharacterized protein